MKKFNSILTIAVMFVMTSVNANAQMINQTNLQDYAKREYGENFDKAKGNLPIQNAIDQNGCMTFTKEIAVPNISKNELYVEMANWFICNYDNSIQFADKEEGVLIARPYIENIARSAGGFNAYDISINPTVRAQISDGKVRVTYTLHDYNVMVEEGGGSTATALSAGLAVASVAAVVADACTPHTRTVVEHYHGFGPFHTTTVYHEYRPHYALDSAVLLGCVAAAATAGPSKDSKTWPICSCYPFVKKDSHKKASNKAYVMANVYSQVVMNNIEAALNQCSLAYNK